jgi:hypothetical protein
VEGVYQSIIRREAVESIENQRRDMIAAAYSNPNWDGKDNAEKRKEYIKDLNRHFNTAIARIYDPKPQEPEIDWTNPFYAAHKREIERTRERLQMQIEGKTAGEILEAEEERKEEQQREDPRSEIDQITKTTKTSDNGRKREFDQLEDDD